MKNWLKRGVLKTWTESKNPKAVFHGRAGEQHEAEIMMPFGVSYGPPENGSEAVLLPAHGNNELLVAIGLTGGKHRPEAQRGGLILYSKKEGHTLEITPDGEFLFSRPDGLFFNMEGDRIKTNMIIETTADIIADGVSLKTHIHVEVEPGAGVSGEPEQ